MSKPNFERHAYYFQQGNVSMVEIWTVMHVPGQAPDNPWIDIEIVTRTAADQQRLEQLGQAAFGAAFAGNVVLPEAIPEGTRQQFGAANQESAINLLVERHPHDPAVRQAAETLVYSL